MKKILFLIFALNVYSNAFNDNGLFVKGNSWTYKYSSWGFGMLNDSIVTLTIDSIYHKADTTCLSINKTIYKCIGDTFYDFRGPYGNVREKPIMFTFFNSDWILYSQKVDSVSYLNKKMIRITKQAGSIFSGNVYSNSLNEIGTYYCWSQSTQGMGLTGQSYELLKFNGVAFDSSDINSAANIKKPLKESVITRTYPDFNKRNINLNGRRLGKNKSAYTEYLNLILIDKKLHRSLFY